VTARHLDNEAHIRKQYRDIRDTLTSVFSKLDLMSKATIRPEISGLFGNQADIYSWLKKIFDELEQVRLEVNRLNNQNESVIDVLEKIQVWQKEYQPILNELKEERARLGKVWKKSGDEK